MRGVAVAAALALTSGLLTGCGVRLDTTPPPIPTASPAEQARAAAVADALAIADAADALLMAGLPASQRPAEGTDPSELLAQIAAGSRAHAQVLGGEWTPPARPTPSDVPSPTREPEVSTIADLTSVLATTAAAAADGAAAADDDLATLLVSVSVWRSLAAGELAALDPTMDPTLAGPRDGVDLLALRLATLDGVDALARGLDAAAFGYETLAARTEDQGLRADWVARSVQLRRTGEVVATSAGISGTAADPREASYDVGALVAGDPTAAAATFETQLATLWIGAPLPGSLRATAAGAALEALDRAASMAQLAALDSPGAVLPGLGAASVPAAG